MCALGKHVFGGLGNNPFNPAMVAYAALLVSFPVSMTQWQDSSPSQVAELEVRWDSITGATSLDKIRNIKRAADQGTPYAVTQSEVSNYLFSSHWFWINICWLLGGLYLLARRIISWHIPLSILTSVTVLYSLQGFLIESTLLAPLPALFSGALLLGAFFIATDPVSAAASISGKLIYGAGIGVLCFIIREYSIYPEGFAFAVLLMNICVPVLDQMFRRA
jgi:electron transport complex protein RnfD